MDLAVLMLDGEIERLRSIMPDAPYTFSKVQRHDWRPFWELARQIQERFKNTRYPTKEQREEAWRRFNMLRDEGNRRATEEREKFGRQSEELRNLILSKCNGISWSRVNDTLFFFDQTTADQVKAWGRYLGEAMAMLRDHKHEMLAEHKQQCFERFQEIKESHEHFWRQYRESRASQQANWEAKRTQHRQRRAEIAAKIESNRANNCAKRRKALEALARQRSSVDDLREKLSETNSRKWQGIYETWIAEAEVKIDDIESSIRRMDEWIEEDERRLRELDE